MPNRSSFQLFSGSERAYLREASGSAFASSLAVPLIFSGFLIGTGYLFTAPDYRGVSGHLVDLGCALAAFLVFVFAKWLPKSISVRNQLFNILVWIIAGFFSSFGGNLAVFALSGEFDSGLASYWLLGAISNSLNIALASVAWSGYKLGRARLAQLKGHQKVLVEMQETLEEQIQTMRGEIRDGVDAELKKVLGFLETPTDEPAELSKRIFAAIDEVVRPLSHRLAGFKQNRAIPALESQKRVNPLPKGVSLSRLAGPEIFGLMFVVFIIPASFQLLGFSATNLLLVLLAAQIGFLFLVEAKARGVLVNRIVAVLFFVAVSLVNLTLFTWLVPNENSFGIAFGFPLLSFAVSTLLALVSRRVDTINRLDLVNFDIQQAVATLRQEAWVLRTALAKAVHGSVQAKFLSVGLRLSSVEKLTDDVIGQAKAEILGSIEDVSNSVNIESTDFRTRLDSFINAWDGVVKIKIKLDDQMLHTLDKHPFTGACIAETLGEAISNAAKHSKSPELDVALTQRGGELLELKVISQGKLSADTSNSGYGSQILSEVTNGWSLTEEAGLVQLTAKFFLAK